MVLEVISNLLRSIEVEVRFNGILEFLELELWERGCLSLLFSLSRSLAEEFPVVNLSFVVFFSRMVVDLEARVLDLLPDS